MSHQISRTARIAINADDAAEIADSFIILASPARVLILGRLCQEPCAVGDLAEAAGLTPSATSHQLRMLRHMGWVTRQRQGRQMIYALHDDHVADLLAQAVFHLEHVRTGQAGVPDVTVTAAPAVQAGPGSRAAHSLRA
ncbi:ArsR/SmtB family transcription factor [Miltoncostaea oceani]|uniref:ArsR/SmtB family transcription factor n=1 Tax=Miltoncostaea oceani TaxID=2843216 RepID=UPI001C3CA149|nr:metalloregulator ArsR/SmtB family transcription factor [Miltoncostaea oceani]